mmetsp:Transcript_57752/g.102455  ORF Transcript_57752/g.102455 Transcript_57752/m.102455 type:complete len:177 (-) Transcript_57752:1079-1609(-)
MPVLDSILCVCPTFSVAPRPCHLRRPLLGGRLEAVYTSLASAPDTMPRTVTEMSPVVDVSHPTPAEVRLHYGGRRKCRQDPDDTENKCKDKQDKREVLELLLKFCLFNVLAERKRKEHPSYKTTQVRYITHGSPIGSVIVRRCVTDVEKNINSKPSYENKQCDIFVPSSLVAPVEE